MEVEAEYFLKVKQLFSGAEYETINLGFWTAWRGEAEKKQFVTKAYCNKIIFSPAWRLLESGRKLVAQAMPGVW